MGPGKYRVEIDVRIGGKRHRPSKLIETELTGKQLKALQLTVETDLEHELRVKLDDPEALLDFTLRDLYKWYIERKNLQQRSKEYYTDYMENRTIEFFKNKKVRKITYDEGADFIKYLDETVSKSTKKPLSQKTKSHYLLVLRALFKEYQVALKRKGIDTINPFYGLSVYCPRRTVRGRFYGPTAIQSHVETLLTHSSTELSLMYVLTLLGGLRPSELRGLTWEKIDFEEATMLIDQTYITTRTAGDSFKSTKNMEPRTIRLIPLAITLLKSHKASEVAKKKRLKIITPIEQSFLFTREDGRPISDYYFRDHWRNFCKEHDFEYKSPYSLRHSTATLLAYKKVPKISIGEQLGHINPKTTDLYIHAVEEAHEQIDQVLEETLTTKSGLFVVGE